MKTCQECCKCFYWVLRVMKWRLDKSVASVSIELLNEGLSRVWQSTLEKYYCAVTRVPRVTVVQTSVKIRSFSGSWMERWQRQHIYQSITHSDEWRLQHRGPWVSHLGPLWVRLAPNGTNLGLFKMSFRRAKMFWKLILKSPRFVPFEFGDNLTNFGPNLTPKRRK